MHPSIILFDGICNFCNATINFIIENDSKGVFNFASLQSDIGKKLLSDKNISTETLETIYLITNKSIYKKSDAIIQITKRLKYYKIVSFIITLFPKLIRDSFYDFIAKNRYSIFGKSNKCRVFSNEIQSRFLR